MRLNCDMGLVCQALMDDSCSFENSNWHSENHSGTRDLLKQCIKHLITERRVDALKVWENKMFTIVDKVEEKLYHQAKSIEEYSDVCTLVSRMQSIVDDLQADCPDSVVDTSSSSSSVPLIPPDFDASSAPKVNMRVAPFAYDSMSVVPLLFPHLQQVSSQGCSRVFIIKVLTYVSAHVKGKQLPTVFTFSRDLSQKWLSDAKTECRSASFPSEEAYYGGPPFLDSDPSTHWTEPCQLYTWWKNNIERKQKFKILQDDALYTDTDPRRIQRARWCQLVVALAETIRASSSSLAKSSQQLLKDENQKHASQLIDDSKARQVNTVQPLVGQYMNQYNPYASCSYNNPYSAVNVRGILATALHNEVHTPLAPPLTDEVNTSSAKSSEVIDLTTETVDATEAPPAPASTASTTATATATSASGNTQSAVEMNASGAANTTDSESNQITSDALLTPKKENIYLSILHHFLTCKSDDRLLSWNDDGLSFCIKQPRAFVIHVLPKYFRFLTTLASFEEYLLSFGFTIIANGSTYYHPLFLRDKPEFLASIKVLPTYDPRLTASTLSMGFVNPGTSATATAAASSTSSNGIEMSTVWKGNPPAPPPSTLPSAANYPLNAQAYGNPYAYLGHPYMSSMFSMPQMNHFSAPSTAAAAASTLAGMSQPFNPSLHNPYSTNFMDPRLSYNNGALPSYLPPYAHHQQFANPYATNPFIANPYNMNLQSYLFQQHMDKRSRTYNPAMSNLLKSFTPRNHREYNTIRKKREAAAAALVLSQAQAGILPTPVAQSAESFLDGTYIHSIFRSGSTPGKPKRNYTKRSKETIEAIRMAKAAKKQARVDRKAILAAIPEVKGRRGRRPRKTRVSESEAEDMEEELINDEAGDDDDNREDESMSEGSEMDDDDAVDGNNDDDTEKASNAPRRSKRKRPKRSARMLLKNSDKLRAPVADRRKGRADKSFNNSSSSSRSKTMQSKQSSADGSIMPYRASYVTNSRQRSEKASVIGTVNSNYFQDGVWTQYDRIRPKVGPECQIDIPALCPPITAREAAEANQNLVWTPKGTSDKRGNKAQLKNTLEVINNARCLKPVDIGSVLVVFLPELNKHRLCCVLDVYSGDGASEDADIMEESSTSKTDRQSSSSDTEKTNVRVFDGTQEWIISLSDCYCFSARHEDTTLDYLLKANVLTTSQLDEDDIVEILSRDREGSVTTWSHEDVKLFCSEIKRCGDNIRKIWVQNFEETKTFLDVLEFFHRIYPHMQGNKKLLMIIHHRAELASAGFPDGEVESSSSSSSSSSDSEDSELESLSEEGDEIETNHDVNNSFSSTVRQSSTNANRQQSVNQVKGRRGRPTKSLVDSLGGHSLLVHAQMVENARAGTTASDANDTSERKSSRKRSFNNRSSNVSEANEVATTELFCVCRTIETDEEPYIACSVGHADRCNGWVHLSCAGLPVDLTDKELQDITDFVCSLCASSSAVKKSRGRKTINEKLQQIEAFEVNPIVGGGMTSAPPVKSSRRTR